MKTTQAQRKSRRLAAAGLIAALLAAPAGFAQTPSSDTLAEIVAIQLRRDQGRLQLHFLLTAPTTVEIAENPEKGVFVVKFQNARPAFAGGQTQFVFNDPQVEGIAFEALDPATSWAKVRLRAKNLGAEVLPSPTPGRVVVALRVLPPSRVILWTGFRLIRREDSSRLELELGRLPTYETEVQGDQFVVRLKKVEPRLPSPFRGEDPRVALVGLERDGEDTLVRILLKDRGLRAVPLLLTDPPRLAFTFREPPPPAVAPAGPSAAEAQAAPPGVDELQALLDQEPNVVVRANYVQGERDYRSGKYASANETFLRIFNAEPESVLGARSFFRAADAQYKLLRAQEANNYHIVIGNYQSAIRTAEATGNGLPLISGALFQIARSYQHMGFDFEANIHFSILQERFPGDLTFTPDSLFYQGVSFLNMRKFEEAAQVFKTFLDGEGDVALQAGAYYQLGDAFYNLGRFPEGKRAFDRARRIDADFGKTRPLLLFHMGETYFENAEFDAARAIYRTLLDGFPEKSYSKLVGLRMGDFLRDEGKIEDALEVYRGIIKQGTAGVRSLEAAVTEAELRLRAKMRIANVVANRPVGDKFIQALALYDEVIAEGKNRPVVEEARLRKALTLSLHGRDVKAFDEFEALIKAYPNSLYVQQKVVARHLTESLRAQVARLFEEESYWDIVRIYTKHKETYFRDFPFDVTLFQVARSYQFLGLFDEALALYEEVGRRKPGALQSLIDYQRAVAFSEKDDLGRAEEALLAIIQAGRENPFLTDVRLLLGDVYFERRQYQDAITAYRLIIVDFEKTNDPRLGEAISESHFKLGRIFKELGRLKEAVEAFQAAVDNFHHPIQGDAVPEYVILSQFFTGDALSELRRDQEAIEKYRRAMARYPEHERAPWAKFQIGLIQRRTGQDRQALETFTELVEQAKTRPGELWETLAQENQRDLVNALGFQDYLKQ
ncbi:MAG: tetratricopeptide repeat protein [SAR324 cluster bacterium]|nr:tetratricopeptide repeat protein [SAR324 cluster bacterium]